MMKLLTPGNEGRRLPFIIGIRENAVKEFGGQIFPEVVACKEVIC
jgi:hypothetical protein